MKSIHIGSVIAKSRKQKGITQEELACYLGVSKPAVSKWESGQSYPDITLLPVIAAYFRLSVDELLGYTPQMESEDIQKLYASLSDAFSREPFDVVLARCRELIRKYYSCFTFLSSMGTLLINHAAMAPSTQAVQEMFHEAFGLFCRVEQESDDTILKRQALQMQGVCYFFMGDPAAVIDLLGDTLEPQMATEVLLAKAYCQKGEPHRAIGLLQTYIYQSMVGIFGAIPDLLSLYAQDPKKFVACVAFAESLRQSVDMDTLHPGVYLPVILTQALLYASHQKNDAALSSLESYAKLVSKPDFFPLKLHTNEFFDNLDSLFDRIDLGVQAPRSSDLIKRDLKKAVIENPIFASLHSDERFTQIIKTLESI